MLKDRVSQLLKSCLWIKPETAAALNQKIETNALNKPQIEQLLKILEESHQSTNAAQEGFFIEHPELKKNFMTVLNKIEKHLLRETETFDRTQTEAEVLTDLESDLSLI